MKKKTLVLIVLDGWGYSEEIKGNAIQQAKTPTWDKIWQEYPHTLLLASGRDVGLPKGQMGNSEVGHLTIGAGRVVEQDLSRINLSIENKSFFTNPVLIKACQQVKKHNSKLHIIGLLSPGGVHSHSEQIFAAIELASQQQVNDIIVHPILDGRDTAPKSAAGYLESLEKIVALNDTVKIGTICGRFFAMDRDNRAERTQAYHDLLLNQNIKFSYKTAKDALQAAYAREETDEFVSPTLINSSAISYNDVVIFMNFRADRSRQICRALTDEDITPHLAEFVTLTKYAPDIKAAVAFPKEKLTNVLGEYLQNNNLTQLRIAETEKFAHVTFFLNGGREDKFINEDRILIPSPKVATYDLCPEMSANSITKELTTAILSDKYDVIFCNYANADMVGHTGNLPATIEAIEVLDSCLHQVIEAVLKIEGKIIITADHGNAEQMYHPAADSPYTAHTTNLIPLVYIAKDKNNNLRRLRPAGSLKDVAPTILDLLGLEKPLEMTGTSLIV